MPALVAGIHVFRHAYKDVDGRNKSGHDVLWVPLRSLTSRPSRPR
jgi:hypothetical protein